MRRNPEQFNHWTEAAQDDDLGSHRHHLWMEGRSVTINEEMENYRMALAYISKQSSDQQSRELAETALNAFPDRGVPQSPGQPTSIIEGAPYPGKMKLVYVKRWRTLIPMPETYADEIVAALAAGPDTRPVQTKGE